ncbi:MAG: methyltransferase domain-containing protein [Bifidobacteriaceae bacterium]|jgi:DNA modification methylase|nr:methyltransferase domain-containing protein [Bifidobacteriaceae bacterium]
MRFAPETFSLESTSVWSFPNRGNWASHDAKYRGNWSPYIPRNLILRYSKTGDIVLDQFAGGGTTLVEAKLLGRDVIGVDVNAESLSKCKEKITFETQGEAKVDIRQGDARRLDFLEGASIDLICTHPPYADIIKYSESIEQDLSLLSYEDFLEAMSKVAHESFRVLRPNKFCAVLMGDIRKKGNVIPLGFEVMNRFLQAGFTLKEIIIKEQHNCKATGMWKVRSQKYNFLLLAHEYLFVFKKILS